MSVSGKRLGMTVDGVVIEDNFAWTVEEGGDVLDRTRGSDNGKARSDTGVDDTKITAKVYLDIATGQYLLVRRGTTLTNLILYVDITDAIAAYEIPEALVTRSTRGGEIRGRLEINIEAVTQGDFTANETQA